MHRFLSIVISACLAAAAPLSLQPLPVAEPLILKEEETPAPDPLELSAPSVLLMEASTGTVVYEKDAHLRPASPKS